MVSTTSIVARPGASMPAPFAMPPIVQPSRVTTAVFATVSVVMMACAALSPPSELSSVIACAVPARTFSRKTSSPVPMSPVEQTSTSPALMPSSSAAFSAVWWVVWNPKLPVKQFAPPELRTTASTTRSATACWDQMMGLALARLLVKTAAPTFRGRG